jgi:hypothetical protein
MNPETSAAAPAHAFVLKDWANYQAGSVVSREVLRKPTGTVTRVRLRRRAGVE